MEMPPVRTGGTLFTIWLYGGKQMANNNGSFCTVINCMDGRVQLPVIDYLKNHFRASYVDSITEAGPVKIIADNNDPVLLKSIKNRLKISIEKHNSTGIAIAAHADCNGNSNSPEHQQKQLSLARLWLQKEYPGLPILALWIDNQGMIHLQE